MVSGMSEHVYAILLIVGLFVMGLYEGQREVMLLAMATTVFAGVSRMEWALGHEEKGSVAAISAVIAWVAGLALLFIF